MEITVLVRSSPHEEYLRVRANDDNRYESGVNLTAG